jgi:hypothetical protein
MRSTISHLSSASPSASTSDILTASLGADSGGWQAIVAKVSNYLSTSTAKASSAPETMQQLSGLLRMQMDVTRYQLRVEVVSKIAESAVASLRKLQQSQ